MARLIATFVALRWRLLRGSLRGNGSERIGVIVSTTLSAVVGGLGALTLAVGGRRADDPTALFVLVGVIVTATVVLTGVVAGVSQSIDPRVLAVEPISDTRRAVGLLAAAAAGPPGIAAVALGIGMAIGAARGAMSLVLVVPAVIAWLSLLLVLSRTVTNLLGLLVNRFPRTGQVLMGVTALTFYLALQMLPPLLGRLEPTDRDRVTTILAWTPVGQLGTALGSVGTSMGGAFAHLLVGALFVPMLAVPYVITTNRLTTSMRVHGGGVVAPGWERNGAPGVVRWLCGRGAAGAIAWRSVLTRFRTPRTAIETFLGAGIGLAAVLAPALLRDDPGSGAVLVGGAVQLAVLFMAGNSFGNDGPALSGELLAGAAPRTLAAGKARSIAVTAAPVALLGPLVAAVVTGEWRFLPAGTLVGFGGLLAGTGGAIVQSTYVPIAMPESENPFAQGESGRGLVAALLLVAVLAVLALFTVPFFLALSWANAFGSVAWVTAIGAGTVVVGWAVLRGGIELARRRFEGDDAAFVAAITPAR